MSSVVKQRQSAQIHASTLQIIPTRMQRIYLKIEKIHLNTWFEPCLKTKKINEPEISLQPQSFLLEPDTHCHIG